MHPLTAITLVFLTAAAWMGGVLLLLLTLDRAQRKAARQVRRSARANVARTKAATAAGNN